MRVGIVGGGQLGRMLALAAHQLGLQPVALDGAADAPAGDVCPLVVGDFGDRTALGQLADRSDVVTFDFENVPADAADWLAQRVRCAPPPVALRMAQDRILEKTLFRDLGIPTADFAAVDDDASLDAALTHIALPAVMKTRRLGYDGKGQRVVRTREDAFAARRELGAGLILESFVAFRRELSVVAVRSQDGVTRTYPLVENEHRDGILRVSTAPAPASPFATAATEYVRRVLDELGYVGTLALELFECEEALLANEFAPRVHNSGHWTIEGAVTSQFENHMRAVVGLPLGATDARGHSAMVNFIGRMPDPIEVLALPGVHLHDYRKAPRPGRKLGHATVTAADADAIGTVLKELRRLAG